MPVYTFGGPVSNEMSFIPTDFLQAERALVWYACRVKNKSEMPWIPTASALSYLKTSGRSSSKANLNIPDWKYFERVMKVIPYGITDGSLTSSFVTSKDLMAFLLKSVGYEEANLQNSVAEIFGSESDFSVYMASNVVRETAQHWTDKLIELSRKAGVLKAEEVFNAVKSSKDYSLIDKALNEANQGSRKEESRERLQAHLQSARPAIGRKKSSSLRGFGSIENNSTSKKGLDPLVVAIGVVGLGLGFAMIRHWDQN